MTWQPHMHDHLANKVWGNHADHPGTMGYSMVTWGKPWVPKEHARIGHPPIYMHRAPAHIYASGTRPLERGPGEFWRELSSPDSSFTAPQSISAGPRCIVRWAAHEGQGAGVSGQYVGNRWA